MVRYDQVICIEYDHHFVDFKELNLNITVNLKIRQHLPFRAAFHINNDFDLFDIVTASQISEVFLEFLLSCCEWQGANKHSIRYQLTVVHGMHLLYDKFRALLRY